MERHEPRGTVHWIDHFIVGTNDMVTWVDWAVNATGITRRPIRGITTTARKKDVPIMCFLWWEGESCRIGAFLQPEVYPSGKPLGEDTPRCGFYIRPEDVDAHLKRLDRHNIPHTDPVRTADGGDEGTVIHFADPDGNQFEFWAPDHMPEGAMEVCTSEGVGRISHAVYGSRDLGKTANFFETYCALQPEVGPNVAEGSLVLRLQAGGTADLQARGPGGRARGRTRSLVGHAHGADRAGGGVHAQLPPDVGNPAGGSHGQGRRQPPPWRKKMRCRRAPACTGARWDTAGRRCSSAATSSTTGTATRSTSSAAGP